MSESTKIPRTKLGKPPRRTGRHRARTPSLLSRSTLLKDSPTDEEIARRVFAFLGLKGGQDARLLFYALARRRPEMAVQGKLHRLLPLLVDGKLDYPPVYETVPLSSEEVRAVRYGHTARLDEVGHLQPVAPEPLGRGRPTETALDEATGLLLSYFPALAKAFVALAALDWILGLEGDVSPTTRFPGASIRSSNPEQASRMVRDSEERASRRISRALRYLRSDEHKRRIAEEKARRDLRQAVSAAGSGMEATATDATTDTAPTTSPKEPSELK